MQATTFVSSYLQSIPHSFTFLVMFSGPVQDPKVPNSSPFKLLSMGPKESPDYHHIPLTYYHFYHSLQERLSRGGGSLPVVQHHLSRSVLKLLKLGRFLI